MNVAIRRDIEQWVRGELTSFAKENEIYPVAWTILVESKEEFLRKRMMHPLDYHQPIPRFDALSEIVLHIHLRKEGKEADKVLFLASFWEEEKPVMKEVVKWLFLVLQSEVVKIYE